MSLSKMLICPYFGDLPPWMDRYWENVEYLEDQGYHFLLDSDEDSFRERVHEKLGIVCPPMWGTGNIWDFRPALGFLYEDEIKGYDFWGHTDFDCVYGRVERFYPDAILRDYDIVTDHWNYLCGPWTLFRNVSYVNNCFKLSNVWREKMEYGQGTGWMETEFTDTANNTLAVRFGLRHAWTQPELLRREGHALYHGMTEIPFFHFRHSKEYPSL